MNRLNHNPSPCKCKGPRDNETPTPSTLFAMSAARVPEQIPLRASGRRIFRRQARRRACDRRNPLTSGPGASIFNVKIQ